jgi:hypothetical protein
MWRSVSAWTANALRGAWFLEPIKAAQYPGVALAYQASTPEHGASGSPSKGAAQKTIG